MVTDNITDRTIKQIILKLSNDIKLSEDDVKELAVAILDSFFVSMLNTSDDFKNDTEKRYCELINNRTEMIDLFNLILCGNDSSNDAISNESYFESGDGNGN